MWAFCAMLTCSCVIDDFQSGLLHPANSHLPAAFPQSINLADSWTCRVTSRGGGLPGLGKEAGTFFFLPIDAFLLILPTPLDHRFCLVRQPIYQASLDWSERRH